MQLKIWFRMLAVLILIAGLAGLGYLVYSAGVAQGAASLESGRLSQPIYAPTPFLTGLITFLLFLFLVKVVGRLFFFPIFGAGMHRRMWAGPMGAGPRRKYWNWDQDEQVPAMFKRWHDRAHGREPAETGEAPSTE